MENIERRIFFQLEQDEGTIVGDKNLQVYISEYYKKLFGELATSTLTLNDDFC
jgi:hypothetical protein